MESKTTPDTSFHNNEEKKEYKEIINPYQNQYSTFCKYYRNCCNWYCKYTHCSQRKICQCQTLICHCDGLREPCEKNSHCLERNTTCHKYHRGHRNIDCYRDKKCNNFNCNFKHSNDETRCCHLNYWDCSDKCTKIHRPCPQKNACYDEECKLKHPRD